MSKSTFSLPVSVQSLVSKPMLERIIAATCLHFGVTEEELKSSISRDIIYQKHICWYLISENVSISAIRIGQRFNTISHATVLRGVDKIRAHKNIYAQTLHDCQNIMNIAITLV